MTDLIEAMARAYYDACPHAVQAYLGGQYRYKNWADAGDGERKNAEMGIRAALAAIDAEGYAVVPKEPTREMKIAWAKVAVGPPQEPWNDWWDAMLAAAPKVTPEKPVPAPCSHCGKPADTKVCGVGGCPLGADL